VDYEDTDIGLTLAICAESPAARAVWRSDRHSPVDVLAHSQEFDHHQRGRGLLQHRLPAATKWGFWSLTLRLLTETTADFAFALMIRRRRAALWRPRVRAWASGPVGHRFLGQDVFGKTAGVFGMGRIGQAFARAPGFSMRPVLRTTPRAAEWRASLELERVSKEELLRRADS